jgi:hypothetical protein
MMAVHMMRDGVPGGHIVCRMVAIIDGLCLRMTRLDLAATAVDRGVHDHA